MCITCFFIYFATPFYPAHLLFMNLITDSLPAIAIGMERNDQNVLKYPPKKKMNLFLGFLLKESLLVYVRWQVIIVV